MSEVRLERGLRESPETGPPLKVDPFEGVSKTNTYLLNKVALKNMQKLHFWFARRRKNHTHSLRSKWLTYISSIQVTAHGSDQDFAFLHASNAKACIKSSSFVSAGPRIHNSSSSLQPWSHLGATKGKGKNFGRRESDIHQGPGSKHESSGSISPSQSTSKRGKEPKRSK